MVLIKFQHTDFKGFAFTMKFQHTVRTVPVQAVSLKFAAVRRIGDVLTDFKGFAFEISYQLAFLTPGIWPL